MSAGDHDSEESKRSYDLPHPSKRTKERHLLAAQMMRERKAMMTSRRVKQHSEEQASNALTLPRGSGIFLSRRANIKQVRGVVSIVGADSCRRFPDSTTINMSYTQQTRTADRGGDIRLRSVGGH